MHTEIVKCGERTLAVHARDDVEAVLDHNKLLRERPQRLDWGRHVATIPAVIIVRWLNEEWQRGSDIRYLSAEWDTLLSRKLRDPEWAYLRTDGNNGKAGWRSP